MCKNNKKIPILCFLLKNKHYLCANIYKTHDRDHNIDYNMGINHRPAGKCANGTDGHPRDPAHP